MVGSFGPVAKQYGTMYPVSVSCTSNHVDYVELRGVCFISTADRQSLPKVHLITMWFAKEMI